MGSGDSPLGAQQSPFFRAAGCTDFDLTPIITDWPFVQLPSPAHRYPWTPKIFVRLPRQILILVQNRHSLRMVISWRFFCFLR
jgi:hypothetical protein